MKKVLNILVDIFIVLLVFVIILNIFTISKDKSRKLPSLFGYKFLIDLTESMIPEISSGDLIVIKEQKSYQKGDILAYRNDDNEIITHRVIDIQNEKYKLKGDNNNASDDHLIELSKIEGVYKTKIPVLGSICLFLTSIHGVIFLIILFISYFLYQMIKKKYYS